MKNFIILSIILVFSCQTKKEPNTSAKENQNISNKKATTPKVEHQKTDTIFLGINYDIGHRKHSGTEFFYKTDLFDGDTIKTYQNVINPENILINGALKCKNSFKNFDQEIANIDSTSRFESDFEQNISWYYSKNLLFKMYDFDSTVFLSRMHLKNDSTFIQYDTIIFNNQTHMDKFKELFPISYLNMERNRTYNGGKINYNWIRVSTASDSGTQFIFLFSENRLKRISYFDGYD